MSWNYQPPLDDMRFVIGAVLDAAPVWARTPGHAALDLETAMSVLEEAGRFASDVLLPINASGDLEGCRRDERGRVRTPSGYREAYQCYVEGGWPSLACDPEWGGQGLPLLLDAAMREMLSACNHGWNMYPDLLHGAYETLRAHASDVLKRVYLPKIASGQWLAAMALTEAQAGSDLGLLRTQARPQPDGSVRVSGNKIFISGGDHDLTDNIVHLVLCRLPDSPPGTRGLSLALVPTLLPDGSRNAMLCEGLEHKMGIHGSATCAMRYESATGWLIGEAGRGLAAMFLMMNSARLHVGLQGLGHQEIVSQNALRYAIDRPQGRAVAGLSAGGAIREPDPIARHPAMRHTLLRLQCMTEAQRVIAYRAALAIDQSSHDPDPEVRDRASALAGLMTPVVKAFLTHNGFQAASAALQVFGGYGYVREYGIEQSLRDSRIAMIYEGTNEIQAIDLLQRKVLADGGAALAIWCDEAQREAARCASAGLADFAASVGAQLEQLRRGLDAVRSAAPDDPECALRVADDFLFATSFAMLAWAFAASARAASETGPTPVPAGKLERMRYGLQWVMPQADVHWQRVREGCSGRHTLPTLVD